MKVLIFILMAGLTGCMISRYSSEADVPAINRALVSGRSINFLTKNGKQFEMNVTYMDSVKITGIGRYSVSGYSDWKGFKGDISLDSIDLVLVNKYNVGKTIVTVGSGLALVSLFSEAVKGKETPELSADVDYTYTGPNQGGGGGSSCPFIYSWTGSEWAIEGEAIGTAFGKALEMQTGTILHSLKNQNGIIRSRITNERPETHYINRLSCMVYEAEEDTKVYLDNFQRVWPVYNLIAPIAAMDNSKRVVLPELTDVDQSYWKSTMNNLSRDSDFRDEIELTFKTPDLVKEASLIIHAVNTRFSETVFQNIFGFLGDQSLPFIRAVENDPEMIAIMNDWLEKSSLKVDVWDGYEWSPAGLIHPVANVVPFAKLIRVPLLSGDQDEIRVRLSCLADVWELDGVFMDFSDVETLNGNEISLVKASSLKNLNVTNNVMADDNKYEILVPGDEIDLTFRDPFQARTGIKKIYVLNVRGYLHEWIIEPEGKPAMQSLSAIQGLDKVSMIKLILSKNELFLPLVYSDWVKKRN